MLGVFEKSSLLLFTILQVCFLNLSSRVTFSVSKLGVGGCGYFTIILEKSKKRNTVFHFAKHSKHDLGKTYRKT